VEVHAFLHAPAPKKRRCVIKGTMFLPCGGSYCIMTSAEDIRAFIASKPSSRRQITCFRCGEQGHYKSECLLWKTRMCWNFRDCTDLSCPFAHLFHEVRKPCLPRCVRVLKQNGHIVQLGCKKVGHTFLNCDQNHGDTMWPRCYPCG